MASALSWRNAYSKKPVESVTMGLDNLKLSVIAKASAVSKDVTDMTIGPNSKPLLDDSDTENHVENGVTIRSSTPVKDYDSNERQDSDNLVTSNLSDIEFQALDESSRSFMKLLNDLDQQRQLTVKNVMNERMKRMNEVSWIHWLELHNKHQYMQRHKLARLLQEEEQILQQQREEEILASKRQQQYAQEHKQHALRRNELNERIKEAEKRQKEAEEEERRRLREKKMFIEKIHQYQLEYRSKYEEFLELARQCKDKQAFASKVGIQTEKLKNLTGGMELLVKQCKIGEISNTDLQSASSIVQQADGILNTVREICKNINDEIDNAKQQEVTAEKTTKEQRVSSEKEKEVQIVEGLDELSDFVDRESFQKYIALQQHLQEYENSYETLLKDDRLKQFRFECQKAVNIPVNAISPSSAAHLQDKLVKLSKLISGQPVEVGHARVSAASHPQGIAFCKNLMARKFVWQGELTVSSKPEAAFAIAAVMEALWADFPDFGELVLAHFYRECPYLVPMFMPQVEGQSNEDYYKSLGYHYNENGEVEKQDKFLKRMSGIMRLYAALLITRPCRYQQNKTNPHGLRYAWHWISCMLNMDPRPDICATLIYDFLEVAGNAMYTHYGQQFQKLLHLLCKEYYPKIEKVTPSVSSGPMIRLEAFLQKILKQGQIPAPVGVLPPNFW